MQPPGSRCSTPTCSPGRQRAGTSSCPSTTRPTTTGTSTASRARTASARSSARGESSCRPARRTTRPTAKPWRGRVRVRRGSGPRRPGRRTAGARRQRGGGGSGRPPRAAMIRQEICEVHPWEIREIDLDLDVLAQMESVLALSNGHIGMRANLDEGEPHGMPGTYLNGVYEAHPLPYAEAAYGDPEAGQTVVNVTDGKLIRLLVDDEPFDVRYGELRSHR